MGFIRKVAYEEACCKVPISTDPIGIKVDNAIAVLRVGYITKFSEVNSRAISAIYAERQARA